MIGSGALIVASDIAQAMQSWTPALTSNGTAPSLGSGGDFLVDGDWYRVGSLVYASGRLRFGSAGLSVGTGDYLISLPTPASSLLAVSGAIGLGAIIGSGVVRDNSAVSTSRAVSVQLVSATTAYLITGTGGAVGAATPWAWAASDALTFGIVYPID